MQKTKKTEVIWVRLGAAGSYEYFDTLEEVAGLFREARITEVEKYGKTGVQADEFKGRNYISLYYGLYAPGKRHHTDPTRDLSDSDLVELNRLLALEEETSC